MPQPHRPLPLGHWHAALAVVCVAVSAVVCVGDGDGCPAFSEGDTSDGRLCRCPETFPLCAGPGCHLRRPSSTGSPHHVFPLSCTACRCHADLNAPGTFEELSRNYAVWHHLHAINRTPGRALVFVCRRMCGGAGDRFRGIVTLFYLALLSARALYIHVDHPQPLQASLAPHAIDWRLPAHVALPAKVDSFMVASNGTALVQAVLDNVHAPVIAITTNLYAVPRLFQWERNFTEALASWAALARSHEMDRFYSLTRHWGMINLGQAPPLRQLEADRVGLGRMNFPLASALHYLFRPSPALGELLTAFKTANQWDGKAPYYGLHLRTGRSFDNDPDRMSLVEIDLAFVCMERMEKQLGLDPATTRWLIATDDVEAWERFQFRLASHGLPAMRGMSTLRATKVQPVHNDRGGRTESDREAELAIYLDFLLLQGASQILASSSSFSRVAAAAGRKTTVTLVPDCVPHAILF